jgi:hypothetical protein
MLTTEQRQAFAELGFVRIPGAFSRAQAQAMEDQLWTILGEKAGVSRTDPTTWPVAGVTGLQPFKKLPVFDAIGSQTTLAVIDDLLGKGRWKPPKEWGQFLVTFPSQEPWTVPDGWHTDFDFRTPLEPLSGLLIFSFLADVAPQGGGTVVLNGSHRLISRFVAAQPAETLATMKRNRTAFLRTNPWLQELAADQSAPDRVARFMTTPHIIDGVPLHVSELSGQAGDIVLGHPLLLHSTAPNSGQWPRFMRIQRIHNNG